MPPLRDMTDDARLAIPSLGLRGTATGYVGAVGAPALLSIRFGVGALRRAGVPVGPAVVASVTAPAPVSAPRP